VPALDQHVGSGDYAAVRSAEHRRVIANSDDLVRAAGKSLTDGGDQGEFAEFRDGD
jgi:hypothetical protein